MDPDPKGREEYFIAENSQISYGVFVVLKSLQFYGKRTQYLLNFIVRVRFGLKKKKKKKKKYQLLNYVISIKSFSSGIFWYHVIFGFLPHIQNLICRYSIKQKFIIKLWFKSSKFAVPEPQLIRDEQIIRFLNKIFMSVFIEYSNTGNSI